jgi:hypothetical protein
MKKRIIGLGLLLLVVTFYNEEILAADLTNPVKLNVNAKKITNKFLYKIGETVKSVNLGWTEKAVTSETGQIAITVTIGTIPTDVENADLIIKVDQVYTTTTNSKEYIDVVSGWLKFNKTFTHSQSVEVVKDSEIANGITDETERIDKKTLTSLRLLKSVIPQTLYLFDYISIDNFAGYVIFTAILVDRATTVVIGVDVQTVFFNYQTDLTSPDTGLWLKLIQSDEGYAD